MEKLDIRFHHMGLAVSSPEKAISFMRMMGYNIGEEVYDNLQKVFLRMGSKAHEPNIELIYKADDIGPINNILSSRKEMIYHTCYATRNISFTVQQIRNNGSKIIQVTKPSPAILFNNNIVAFYFISGFGLIEFLETLNDF